MQMHRYSYQPYDISQRPKAQHVDYDDDMIQKKPKRKAHPLDILAEDIGMPREQIDEIASHKYEGPIEYIRSLCYCSCGRYRERNRQKAQPEFVQHVIDLYRKQNGRCALSGIVLTWNEQPNHFTNISIDRIDSDQGYEIGNVRLIAVWVNNALANFSEETMWMFVQSLASKMQSKRTVSTNEQASSSYPNHTLGTRDGLSRIVH